MFIKQNYRIKPLYKQLLKLRENIQNRKKLLKFKRKKWTVFIEKYKKTLKWYNTKPIDQTRYLVTTYASKGTSRKKQFRNTFTKIRALRMFYGNLTKKQFKKQINYIKNFSYNHLLFLKLFEKRLDTVLFRAKFAKSIRNARQLITHGIVKINNKQLGYPSYILKESDLISINPKYSLIIENNLRYCLRCNSELNLVYSELLPIPPKHLLINYRTLEIIFNNIDLSNFSPDFSYHLNLEKIILIASRK